MAEPVSWGRVLTCFSDRHDAMAVIRRLSNEWADRYGLDWPQFGHQTPVNRETWAHDRVGRHLDALALLVPELITDLPPRRMTGPLVLIDFGQGRVGQIDGRRRANLWRDIPGQYEVLRIIAG